ncbi:MAG: dihydrodipicolinate synthase family protein [Pirellulales bacterium]
MPSLDLARFATVQLVPCTPFSADGKKVLVDRLGDFVRDVVAAGIRVLLPAAGTGEFQSLSAEEIVACVRVTRQAAGPDVAVVAPIGFGLGHALSVGRGAVEAGADALLLMPPIHPYLCDAGLRDYFQAITGELPLPVLAYKKGPHPSDELLLELAREGKLAGVKYANNDLDAVGRFAAALDPQCGLYCGTAERFAPYFALAGATGYTSGAGNLCPRLTLSMHAALAAGDWREAMRLLAVIRPIEDFRARAGDSYNISMLKYALTLTGRDFGPPRPPQRRIMPADQAEIRRIVEPILAAEARL